MVNRIWQHHMGAGIVRTPNNFGAQGDRPTHPELLDFLADYFVRSGWSIKAVHRLILNSAVYQQSSIPPAETLAQDPDNRLWGRMNRRRLDAKRSATACWPWPVRWTQPLAAWARTNWSRRAAPIISRRCAAKGRAISVSCSTGPTPA